MSWYLFHGHLKIMSTVVGWSVLLTCWLILLIDDVVEFLYSLDDFLGNCSINYQERDSERFSYNCGFVVVWK